MVLLLYVDDIVFVGEQRAMEHFQKAIQKRFKIKIRESAREFIGIEMQQQKHSVTIHQQKHIEEAVKKFDLNEAKPVNIPIDVGCLNDFASPKLEDKKLYQSLLGVLNYICNSTRPDVAFAVNFLATKASAPTVADLRRAKRCLVYLRDTKDLQLRYPQLLPELSLELYVDASYASGSNRRSVYGFVIFLNKAVIHFKTKQQSLVTLSSTEAEFVALVLGIKELKWIYQMIEEIGLPIKLAVVFCDNQGALKILKNEASTARTKHIDVRLQFLKEQVRNGLIETRYVQTNDQIADLFTKPLGRLAFDKLRNFMLYH